MTFCGCEETKPLCVLPLWLVGSVSQCRALRQVRAMGRVLELAGGVDRSTIRADCRTDSAGSPVAAAILTQPIGGETRLPTH